MKRSLALGDILSRKQQSSIVGGKLALDCSAKCPPGQSAACSGFESCKVNKDDKTGAESGVTCYNPGITLTVECS